MTSKGQSAVHIMKFVVLILIIGFVILLMLYASDSNKSFEEVSESVEDSLDTGSLTVQDAAAFKRKFGLNAADYTGVLYYSSEAAMSAEEVLLVKVKTDSQVQEVVDAVNDRIDSRISDFEGYLPDEVKLLEDAGQSVRGTFVFYVCSPDADDYLSVFSSSL